jgi:hypothetical protein
MKTEKLFEYPSPIMRKNDLVKLGIPKGILEDAYYEKGQKLACKQNPSKRNSPILFDTAKLDAWLHKRISIGAKSRELHMT